MNETGLGLTRLLAAASDAATMHPSCSAVREALQDNDRCALRAYDWSDLEDEVGIHQIGQASRIGLSPRGRREVIFRLLALNQQRYEAEFAAGLHGRGPTLPRASKKMPGENGSTLFGAEA
jgi:hypothetical protein